ncbi:MAG TPA: PA14 domain-containing protein [Polyangiaceae bacterium]|nr:PA14 domain-containing protein [Polyangiaceae bacterium]
MVRRSLTRSLRILGVLLLPLGLSCSHTSSHSGLAGGGSDAGTGGTHEMPNPGKSCSTPQEGCPCSDEGQVIECGDAVRHSEGYTACGMGERVCLDGKWGECEGAKIYMVPDPAPGAQTQGLGTSKACVDNPCDPYCQIIVDDSKNLDVSMTPGLTNNNGITLTPVPQPPSANNCTGIALDPPTQTLTVTAINPTTGLLGEYFNQRDNNINIIPANWTVTASRVDASVNFQWGNGAPGPAGIGVDNFSVRWSGFVTAPTTEAYTFYATGDDGVRLWVDGNLVVNAWWDQGPTEYASAAINLTKGVPVSIRMEYFEHGGGATAELRWSSASVPKNIISEAYLTPPNNALPPFVVSPATAPLTVNVVPPDCYEGTVTAAWGLDTLDRATVSNQGVVSLVSPVAGTMNVSAYVQQFKATAQVNVVVNATDTLEAPTGAAATYTANVSSGADTATILYPYDGTVFPLALKPPVLQWDPGANGAASAVKVRLRYPAVGTATYSWSKIIAEPANYRYAFTRDQWGLFERTAKGGTGRISIQRIVGGQLKDAVAKNVTFASTPLRGKIFYTQYGGGYSDIMRLDPGGDIAAARAFSTANGCPVCHSMSANGTKFATSNWTWSTNGGISNVDSAGNLTVLSDFQNPGSPYSNGSNDWRGFAWAPFTPDGNYILATNNIYGNTNQSVVGIDTTTRAVSLPAAVVSGGRGIGLLADYYATNNWTGSSWRRIDPRPDFDWTGSPGGPIPADGFTVAWNGFVEGLFTETTTFEVETNIGVRLTVGGNVIINQLANNQAAPTTTKFTGTAALTRGAQTSIKLEAKDMNAESIVKLRWQGANAGATTTPYQLIPQSQLFPSGGPYGAQAKYTDGSGHTITRLESDLYYDWGGASPNNGVSSDNPTEQLNADFSSTWDAQIEAPVAATYTLQINSDDGYTVKYSRAATPTTWVSLGTGAGSTGNAFVTLGTTVAMTAGEKINLHVDHTDTGGAARMLLNWKANAFITSFEPIPMARTFPPTSWTAPTTGLSATFYDTMDFGGALLTNNSTTPQAYQTYVPYLDFDWSGERFSYGRALTNGDTMSGRFTGRLQPACTGVTEFEIFADDTVNIWIGGERLIQQTSWGTRYAARYLDAALLYDFKVDWTENGGGAGIRVRWKPSCNGATSYKAIPGANFKPTGDTTLNGYIRQGGDNGNGAAYVVWKTPNAVGATATDVTSQSPGNWGLGQSVMMVPSFSPDASKLVFVDGDSATNSGWRKGLSTFDFDQNAKLFKNRRQIVNNFPSGDVIKWPAYESDSKSVLYQTTTAGDMCCRGSWTKYGYMGPTNYFEDPGKIWSVDSTAANPTPVSLDKLNNGERTIDRNKSYQITMLPTPAGGYRWSVFTSTRPYGNTLNLPATQQDYSNPNSYTAETNASEIQSMLWVSAIDDATSAATDRSHPAFFLPNQAYSDSGGHYLNERAYWVTEACRPAGSGAGSACDVDEDCCGGTASPKTGVCRIDTPITQPATRHCASVPPPNACLAAGSACTADTDCCFNYPCVANVCTKPPPLPTFTATNFTRQYTSECGMGTKVVWRFFDWQAVTPPIGSAIEFYAESSDDPSTFHTLPAAPTAVAIAGVVKIATVTGATVMGWVGKDVGALLTAAGVPQRKYLQITARLQPNTKNTDTPVLTDWRQAYSCPPQE